MNKIILITIILPIFIISCNQNRLKEITYRVAPSPWGIEIEDNSSQNSMSNVMPTAPNPFSLGNHRAIINVPKKGQVIHLDLEWRRHDKNLTNPRFIIINSKTQDTIRNIYRIDVNNERCEILFGPANAGDYYFYYLPFGIQKTCGLYKKGYLPKENRPEKEWLDSNNLSEDKINDFPKAKVLQFQSRTEFDSFYPMEVIALKKEKDSLLNIYKNDFLVFPEDRKFAIRMLDEIPQRWIQNGPSDEFQGEAKKNEYYTFQLGIFAAQKELGDLKVEFSALKNGDVEIPISNLSCFNTGGIGPYGKSFVKRVDVAQGNVQPLWIGVDIPEDIEKGKFKGTVTVSAKNAKPQTININLKITKDVLADRGDSEAWRYSRLRWLNSTLGNDDEPTLGYNPISFLGDKIQLTGKTVQVLDNGFPGSIKVKGTEILNRPISFVVETKKGKEQFSEPKDVQVLKNSPGKMIGAWESISKNLKISGTGTIESDGYINYKLTVKVLNSIEAKDIRLEIPFKQGIAKYMMGMGLPGTTVPQKHNAKWKGPHDSFWIGNTNAGIWCELRGDEYHGPLLNLYHTEYPPSWYNDDKGGFKIESTYNEIKALVYSGPRNLLKGEELEFEWSFLITPVKDINYKSQFNDRYYHNCSKPMPSDEDLKSGIKIVNLHHATNYNPHISYPFVAVDSMKWFVDKMHEKGLKVKIYYTIRELSNYTSEIWALRSLGNEVLGNGNGGGYPWLREHLVSGYSPQWYHPLSDKITDASIVNARDSRWYNYYIAGLEWLVKNVDIDGLYLDEVSLDRRTIKRMRKVLDNTKPGCMIELHGNTAFCNGPATRYAEFFPYMDKLWFGEGFNYYRMPPENWLVETSGIPFGLMGDMLMLNHGGGNRWLGMLFGMTVRFPWITEGVICDPRPVWKIWDEFQIQDAEMIGFWEDDCPVKTTNPDVKTTVYKKKAKSLISIGNFSDSSHTVSLNIDFKELGLDPGKVKLIAPLIQDFQPMKEWMVGDEITVEPRKGWLIYIEPKLSD